MILPVDHWCGCADDLLGRLAMLESVLQRWAEHNHPCTEREQAEADMARRVVALLHEAMEARS